MATPYYNYLLPFEAVNYNNFTFLIFVNTIRARITVSYRCGSKANGFNAVIDIKINLLPPHGESPTKRMQENNNTGFCPTRRCGRQAWYAAGEWDIFFVYMIPLVYFLLLAGDLR